MMWNVLINLLDENDVMVATGTVEDAKPPYPTVPVRLKIRELESGLGPGDWKKIHIFAEKV